MGLTEFGEMINYFLGEDYDQEKVRAILEEKRKLHKAHDDLLIRYEAGSLSPEVYVDTFNIILRNTFENCERLLGKEDFEQLFGGTLDEAAGFIDKVKFLIEEDKKNGNNR